MADQSSRVKFMAGKDTPAGLEFRRNCRPSGAYEMMGSDSLPWSGLRVRPLGGQIEFCHVLGNSFWISFSQVGQYNDGQLVIQVTRDVCFEALPGAAVIDQSVAVDVFDLPAKSIVTGIRLPVVQLDGSPHLFQA